jgi:hypothetical protein
MRVKVVSPPLRQPTLLNATRKVQVSSAGMQYTMMPAPIAGPLRAAAKVAVAQPLQSDAIRVDDIDIHQVQVLPSSLGEPH